MTLKKKRSFGACSNALSLESFPSGHHFRSPFPNPKSAIWILNGQLAICWMERKDNETPSSVVSLS
jgi:hypothetical protein